MVILAEVEIELSKCVAGLQTRPLLCLVFDLYGGESVLNKDQGLGGSAFHNDCVSGREELSS